MKSRKVLLALGGVLAFVVAGCASSDGPRPPRLTEEQEIQLESYRALQEGSLFVDELQTSPTSTYEVDPYTQSYEGYRVLRLLGLVDQLSLADQYEFIAAVFRDIPNPVVFAAPIRNIAVGQWYENDEPLIVHITLAFTDDQIPAIVAAFNAQRGIRQWGHQVVRFAEPAVEYPRFAQTDDRTLPVFREQYVWNVFDNGQVSASRAAGRTDLPDFSTVQDVRERVNLTDDYLRDGNPDNDAVVVPVLEAVIEDESVPALSRVHASLQLAVYHLFAGDVETAQLVSDEILASELMELPEVSETELAEVARIDLPNILAIAAALESGDPSGL